jgi:uncharacterized membrane protein YeaQ/YmgE (transglycosylase-associated protein family)
VTLDATGLVAWLAIGAVAGWLVGRFVRGSGYGPVGDVLAGVVGALAGTAALLLLGAPGSVDLVVALGVGVGGALAAIVVVAARASRLAPARTATPVHPPTSPPDTGAQ